jgi:hypothetical protein
VRVNNLPGRFSYDIAGYLVRLNEIGYGENSERLRRPQQLLDSLGWCVQTIVVRGAEG